MQMRLREICLDKKTRLTIKESPLGWKRLLRMLGYKKVYLNGGKRRRSRLKRRGR